MVHLEIDFVHLVIQKLALASSASASLQLAASSTCLHMASFAKGCACCKSEAPTLPWA